MDYTEESGTEAALTAPAPNHTVTGDDDMAKPQRSTSPAFQFYPKEFLSSSKVIAMSATERGAYITLLSVQWLDGSLPNDISALAKIAGITGKSFARMWPHNLARCFVLRGGRFYNERLERERKKQAEYRQRQTDNAAKGWDSRRNATAVPPTAPHQASGNAFLSASPSPISDLQSAQRERRPQPIIHKRRPDAAFEGPRVYVPQRKHNDFVALRNHPAAADELFTWYERISEEWATGRHAKSEPGSNMLAFWDARYAEQWPATVQTPTTAQRRPAWAVKS